MRILCTSDWHADKRTLGVDRYKDVAEAAQQTVDAAILEHVDLWAFLGDLADPEDGPLALRALQLAIRVSVGLRRAGIRQLWVPGNHDVVDDGSGRTTLSPLYSLKDGHDDPYVAVCDAATAYPAPGRDDVVLVALPFVAAGNEFFPKSIESAVALAAKKYRTGVVFAHATRVDGAKEGEETTEMPRGRGVRLPTECFPTGWTVVNGHYHKPQTTPSGVIVPGALARLTFGEEANVPRYVILSV